ncbi:hypothetical protein F511_37735 [Dorcoceras hygrometricum]|uniref:Uncharacterized protein n=1 Tax=Dorcoceras hygrometricum TaxID=472368 RepID=A0A2Z7B4A4_9LAMI|nr:hypothetical protein F511_37735 [Dorcoceras hygrometricum]
MDYNADAPHNHLGTRGSSYLLTALMHDARVGRTPKDALPDRDLPEASPLFQECFPRTMSRRDEESCLAYIFSHFCSRTLPDLSIGGASLDTLPVPSDQLSVVADIKEKHNPVPRCPKFPSSSKWWCLLVG